MSQKSMPFMFWWRSPTRCSSWVGICSFPSATTGVLLGIAAISNGNETPQMPLVNNVKRTLLRSRKACADTYCWKPLGFTLFHRDFSQHWVCKGLEITRTSHHGLKKVWHEHSKAFSQPAWSKVNKILLYISTQSSAYSIGFYRSSNNMYFRQYRVQIDQTSWRVFQARHAGANPAMRCLTADPAASALSDLLLERPHGELGSM